MLPTRSRITMSEDQSGEKQKETEHSESSKQHDILTQKISVEIKAINPIYEIEINTKGSVSEIPNLIDAIINEIEKSKKFTPTIVKSTPPRPQPSGEELDDDPLSLLAIQLEVDYNALKQSRLLSIKNQTAQILKSTALTSSESCYLLLAANEYGLGKASLSYGDWKELCDTSKIKSKLPFYKFVNNAKNLKNINKKAYENNKEIILEPKGLDTVKTAVSKYLKSSKKSSK